VTRNADILSYVTPVYNVFRRAKFFIILFYNFLPHILRTGNKACALAVWYSQSTWLWTCVFAVSTMRSGNEQAPHFC